MIKLFGYNFKIKHEHILLASLCLTLFFSLIYYVMGTSILNALFRASSIQTLQGFQNIGFGDPGPDVLASFVMMVHQILAFIMLTMLIIVQNS